MTIEDFRPVAPMKVRRILFYSHDTFGLGHIRRTQKLANTIAGEQRAILIACASPKASSFGSLPGIEYLNLPGFTKQVTGDYVPRSLPLHLEEFVNLRASLLLSAVRSFDPDVFVIDKEPLGVKRELLPSLEFLKFYQKRCRVICGFRDILDEREAVEKEWRRRDTLAALDEYFHAIYIYGEKELFDYALEYPQTARLKNKIHYLGFLPPDESSGFEPFTSPFGDSTKPLVTLTLGGGGDGQEILEAMLEILKARPVLPFNAYILTGPFSSPAIQSLLQQATSNRPDAFVTAFIPNSLNLFRASDVILCMGGYNTMTELMHLRKFPLILPRIKPRTEQLIRAQAFQRLGLCDYLSPDNITAESLFCKIMDHLSQKPKVAQVFPMRGLKSFSEKIEELL